MVKINPLTDDDLKQRNTNYFEEGVHPVIITAATRGETKDGKEYVEFIVLGQNDEEDTARMWFTTEKAAKYTLSILAGIASHNKDTEAAKEKVREEFKKITDTDIVDDKFLRSFINKDAWFSVYKSERTYTAQDGSTKHSYDKNIYGYEPKPRTGTVSQMLADSTPVDDNEVPFE